MSDGLSELKEEDVQRLARLIESLESSSFDYLQLQVGDLKVTIGKGAVPVSAPVIAVPGVSATAAPGAAANGAPGTPVVGGPSAPPANANAAAPAYAPPHADAARPSHAPPTVAAGPAPGYAPQPGKRTTGAAPAGTIEIKSQIMGMFYQQPEPGSPPFVSVGTAVKEDTTVCLIEVMKTFNAMTAGVKGVITEICVENAQMVEYGQVLFRVRPS